MEASHREIGIKGKHTSAFGVKEIHRTISFKSSRDFNLFKKSFNEKKIHSKL